MHPGPGLSVRVTVHSAADGSGDRGPLGSDVCARWELESGGSAPLATLRGKLSAADGAAPMRGLQAHCPVWQRGVWPPLPSQRVGNRSLVFLAASSEEQMCRREHGNGVGQSVRSDTHTLLSEGGAVAQRRLRTGLVCVFLRSSRYT